MIGGMSEHTVGEVARLAGVSVRTLHHYDEIGLLPPSGRSESGYRLYSAADVERLRRILFYRELDFPLEEIARSTSRTLAPTTTCAASTGCCAPASRATPSCCARLSTRWRHARWESP